MDKIKLLAFAVSLTALAMPAHALTADLVVNGGFEDSSVTDSSGYRTFSSLSQGLAGWTVGMGSVDLVGSYWDAASGSNSLDLNGSRKGEIHQSLLTTAGQLYQLSFDMAGNFAGGPAIKGMTVNVDGKSYSFDTTGRSAADMGWTHYASTFIALSNSAVLSFASNISGAYGPALDNVSVVAVPELPSYAMLIVGLGLMGTIASRRSRGREN